MTALVDGTVELLSPRPHQEAAITAVERLYRAGHATGSAEDGVRFGQNVDRPLAGSADQCLHSRGFRAQHRIGGANDRAWRATGLRVRALALWFREMGC